MKLELTPLAMNPRQQHQLNAWLAAKKGAIGGSQAATACGMGRFGSKLRLWAEMVGRDTPDDISAIELVHWGNVLESPVAIETAKRLEAAHVAYSCGTETEEVGRFDFKEGDAQELYRSVRLPWMHYSPDGFLDYRGKMALLEIKTTGVWAAGDWKGDEVPDYVNLQVQHGMYVLGLDLAVVAVLIGGQELRVFEVERNEKAIALLLEQEALFIRAVDDDVEPSIEDPVHSDTEKALKRLHPDDNGQTTVLASDVAAIDEELQEAKLRLKELAKRKKDLETRLRALIGDFSYGQIDGTQIEYTLLSASRAEHLVAAATFRTLRRKDHGK